MAAATILKNRKITIPCIRSDYSLVMSRAPLIMSLASRWHVCERHMSFSNNNNNHHHLSYTLNAELIQ